MVTRARITGPPGRVGFGSRLFTFDFLFWVLLTWMCSL